MIRKRPLTSSLFFFVAVAAALCVWLLFIAPVFQEKERVVRSENAALVKDIAEIETMDGSTDALDLMIAETDGNIRQRFESRAETADAAAAKIESLCKAIGITPTKIGLGPINLLHPAGAIAPALYSVDITFRIDSTKDAGPPIIRALESSASADFEVRGFVFRSPLPAPGETEDGEAEGTAEGGTASPGEAEDGDPETYADPNPVGEWIFTVTMFFYE